MFSGLKERTRFGKKKRKKKLIAVKSGLVGMKGYQDIQVYEIFFAVFRPFLNETAF